MPSSQQFLRPENYRINTHKLPFVESNINEGEILEDTSKFRGTYSQVTRQKLRNIAVIRGSFTVV